LNKKREVRGITHSKKQSDRSGFLMQKIRKKLQIWKIFIDREMMLCYNNRVKRNLEMKNLPFPKNRAFVSLIPKKMYMEGTRK
jgi:hypothetical protein